MNVRFDGTLPLDEDHVIYEVPKGKHFIATRIAVTDNDPFVISVKNADGDVVLDLGLAGFLAVSAVGITVEPEGDLSLVPRTSSSDSVTIDYLVLGYLVDAE